MTSKYNDESEKILVSDWLTASKNTLAELWDNEDDKVYDALTTVNVVLKNDSSKNCFGTSDK